jgi:hypothetical protein
MSLVIDCENLHALTCADVPPECYSDQTTLRRLVVFSNVFFFLIPFILYHLRKRDYKEALQLGDYMVMSASVFTGFFSSVYHYCDDADKTILCDQHCLVGAAQLHQADVIAAGWLLHVAFLFNYNPKPNSFGFIYIVLSNMWFPYGAVYSMHIDYAYLYYVMGFAAVDLLVQVRFPDFDRSQICDYTKTHLERWLLPLQRVFPMSGVMGWSVWLPLAFATVLMAVFLEYTQILSGEYVINHSTWHMLSAFGLFFWLLARIHKRAGGTDGGTEQSLYTPLHQVGQAGPRWIFWGSKG